MPVAVSNNEKRSLRPLTWILILLVGLPLCTELLLHFGLGLGSPVLVAPDSACSYILAPNQSTYRFFCRTHTDRFGMRSDPFAPIPAPGTLRIMFIGDSVTYGTSHIDQSRIFTEVLHRELPSVLHQPVEVLNASAGGWAIDNELSWLRSRGTFGATTVILVLNSGDLGQPRADIHDAGDETPQTRPRTAFGEIWDRFLKPRLFHAAPRIDAGDSAPVNAGAIIHANLAELDAFQKLSTADGARMAVLYIPFRNEIPSPAKDSEQTLAAWTAAHHVPFFDMTDVEARYPTKQVSLDGDHLTSRGHRLVAEAVEKEWTSKFGK